MNSVEILSLVAGEFARLAELINASQDARASTVPLAPPFSNMTQDDWARSVHLWVEEGITLLRSQPDRACPACGGNRSTFLFMSYDGYPFHECELCYCWFVPKKVDNGLFEAFFARCPEAAKLAASMTERRAVTLEAADAERIGAYLDELLTVLGEGRHTEMSYLDPGCGVGHSLQAALKRGIKAHGVEVDRSAMQRARAKGLSVSHPSEPLPAGPYRLMTFLETLEHISDPLAALQRYLPYLDSGALVTVTVPNLASPSVRILRGECAYVHGGANTPGHINLFHVGSLTRLLERAGFVVLDADAQFSNNPVEIAGYLLGRTRPVRDMLAMRQAKVELPELVAQALNSVWPAVSLIERSALTAPILKVLACRQADAGKFSDTVAAVRRRRQEEIHQQAIQLRSGAPDYRRLVVELQEEVNIRDRMLQDLQAQINGLQNPSKR